ncbi:unnamed protein product [Owenia fusiformis]|uniref:Uncharacterized protein n=1 Tax=Owenia fusiformis TaxID=6347 RepID=A0A8J1Y7U9_OWEFU|nr:unnamed protein product [Owenia fusiformis]
MASGSPRDSFATLEEQDPFKTFETFEMETAGPMSVFTLDKLNKDNNRLIAENYFLRRAIELRKHNSKLKSANVLAGVLSMLDDHEPNMGSILSPVAEILKRHKEQISEQTNQGLPTCTIGGQSRPPNVPPSTPRTPSSIRTTQPITTKPTNRTKQSSDEIPSPPPSPPRISPSDLAMEPEHSSLKLNIADAEQSKAQSPRPARLNTSDLPDPKSPSFNDSREHVIFIYEANKDRQNSPRSHNMNQQQYNEFLGQQVVGSKLQSSTMQPQHTLGNTDNGYYNASYSNDGVFPTRTPIRRKATIVGTIGHGYIWEADKIGDPIAMSTPIQKRDASTMPRHKDMSSNTMDVKPKSHRKSQSMVHMSSEKDKECGSESRPLTSKSQKILVTPGHGEVYDYYMSTQTPSALHASYTDGLLNKMNQTKRIIGEIAFQLDRRILFYVFNKNKKSGEKMDKKRFYGYTIGNLEHMIKLDSCDPETGKLNHMQYMNLKYRFDFIKRSLYPLGYRMEHHPNLAIKLVNKYGLLHGPPVKGSVDEQGINNPLVVQHLLRKIVPRHEIEDVLIIFESLVLLAHDDGKALFLW